MKSVSPTASPRTRGTVTLVALCFVTVMGIMLAGWPSGESACHL